MCIYIYDVCEQVSVCVYTYASVMCEIEYVWYVCENICYVCELVVAPKVFIGNLPAKESGWVII